MAKPFKFRYVNEIAGTFAGAIGLVLIVVLLLAGRAQKWFQHVRHVTIMLPVDGSYGLKEGGEVRMMGVTVGAIDQINPPDQNTGQMTMVAHLDPRFAQFICGSDKSGKDSASKAIIRIPLGIGDPYLEITRGKGTLLPTDVTLAAEPESGAADAINQTIADVRSKTLPAVAALLKEYTDLAADLRNQEGPVQQTLAHIDHMSANLERSDSVLGMLTNDKKMADSLNQAVLRLTSSVDEIHAVLANLQQSTAQFPTVISSLNRTVDSLPGVMVHTQQTLIEVQKLVKGLQNLPIIRDHVDQTPGTESLQPSDVGGPQ